MPLKISRFIKTRFSKNFCINYSLPHKRLHITTRALKKIAFSAEQCESVMCGLHQWCRLDDNGRPECYCHQACHKIEAPVCGRKNSKQYVNTCELKREECLIQKIIGMDLGRCRGNVSKVVIIMTSSKKSFAEYIYFSNFSSPTPLPLYVCLYSLPRALTSFCQNGLDLLTFSRC